MSFKSWAGMFVLLEWPFTEQTKTKKRSALILSEPDACGDLRLLKVSSKSNHDHSVAVSISDLANGALKQTLFITIDYAITAHESLLKPIGVRLKPIGCVRTDWVARNLQTTVGGKPFAGLN